MCKTKYRKSKSSLKNRNCIYSTECVWKMAKNFNLQNEAKSAYEVQKYKCMYGKSYKQYLFSLSQKMSFTKTKLSFF